ncbi:MAG: hypothetical protein MGF17_15030 [Trichodesmium sp. MAG_R04]|nr:hypothetical protein [Trichodesmium sp. MAG_R04]
MNLLYQGVPSIFIPTTSGREGSLKFCSFNILGVAELNEIGKPNISNYRRIAYVAEAVKPSEVEGRRKQLISTHKSSAYTGHISFPELEKKEFEKSEISYKGEKYTLIDI